MPDATEDDFRRRQMEQARMLARTIIRDALEEAEDGMSRLNRLVHSLKMNERESVLGPVRSETIEGILGQIVEMRTAFVEMVAL